MKLGDMDEVQLRTDLRALEEMIDSRGWAVLTEFMEREALDAVMAMGSKISMSVEETAFKRGAIYASNNVRSAPTKIISVIATELLMRKGVTVPATAGTGRD